MATMIVAGFDGSNESRAAVRWALDEAAVRGVALRVVTAVQDLTGDGDDQVVPEVAVVDGNQSAVLIRESMDAALLVIGARGLGGLSGMLLGSVSRVVVEHAMCPVTIVR